MPHYAACPGTVGSNSTTVGAVTHIRILIKYAAYTADSHLPGNRAGITGVAYYASGTTIRTGNIAGNAAYVVGARNRGGIGTAVNDGVSDLAGNAAYAVNFTPGRDKTTTTPHSPLYK